MQEAVEMQGKGGRRPFRSLLPAVATICAAGQASGHIGVFSSHCTYSNMHVYVIVPFSRL